MSRPTTMKVDGTVYWAIFTYTDAGVLVDADSDPTVAVRKNGGSTLDLVSVTKRAATTGIYDCSHAPSGEIDGDTFGYEETVTVSAQAYLNRWSLEVRAAAGAGGGDATLANQTTILANQTTILADTNELQTNQGQWLTADVSLLATESNVDNVGTISGQTFSAVSALNDFNPAVDSVDVGSISGNTAAGTNLSAQFDGTTGLTGDLYPATQAAVQNIGSAGPSQLNYLCVEDNTSAPIKGRSFVGIVQSGTYLDLANEDGVVMDIDDQGNDVEVVYGFSLGGDNEASSVEILANVDGNGDQLTVQAYNFVDSIFETIGVIIGSGGSAFKRLNVNLLARHTGSAADLGKVYISFTTTSTTPNTLYVDKINVGAVTTSKTIGYVDASVWVNTISGTAGSEAFVNGVADNPTTTYASANLITAEVGLNRYTFSAGDNITLTQSHLLDSFFGYNYTLNMNSQVAPNFIEGSEILGITTNTTAHYVRDCRVGTIATPYELAAGAVFVSSGLVNLKLKDAAGAALDVEFLDCHGNTQGSMFPGGTIDFGTTAGTNHEVSFQRWGGPVTLVNMKAGDIVYFHGNGTAILDASCTGGSFRVAGMINLIDNSGGAVGIVEDGRITKSGVAAEVWDTVQSSHTTAGTFGLYLDSEVSAAGGGTAPTEAEMYTYFTSASRQDAFKADVSLVALQSTSLSIVADTNELQTNQNNWLTATGFNTVAPDNASIAAILADTNELQVNQGQWVTATGFNTIAPDNAGIAAILVDTADLQSNQGQWLTATTTVSSNMRGTDSALLASAAPSNWTNLIVGTGADLGKVTTSNPAAGSGSSHTAQDVANLILAVPTTPLGNTATGSISLVDTTTNLTNAGSGGDDAATIYSYFTAGSNEDAFKADVSGLATSGEVQANGFLIMGLNDFDPASDTIARVTLVDTTTDLTNGGGGGGDATLANQVTILANQSTILADTSDLQGNQSQWLTATTTVSSNMRGTDGANTVTPDNAGVSANGVAIAALNDFDPALDTIARVTLVDTTTDLTNQVNAGPSLSQIVDGVWNEPQGFHTTSGTFGYYLDAQVSTAGSGGSGLYQATIRVQDNSNDALQGARVNIDGTTLTLTTDSSGEVTFNLDSGVYLLEVSPPAGYDTPTGQVLTVSTSDPADTVFTLTSTSPPTGCDVPWLG